jgi:arylsulfatase A-like enzyme
MITEARLPLPPTISTEAGPKPNILVIVIDTLRADHLSCYGYKTISTPNIDAFAYDGVLFHNMFTQSSWTKPSFASILSSTYPSTHQAIGKPDMFSSQNLTLPEILHNNGYYTAAITNNVNVSDVFNFDQGFVEFTYLEPDFFFFANEAASKLNFYDVLRKVREKFLVKKKKVEHYYKDAETVNEHIIHFLETYDSSSPFFLFVHYMDPHDPFFIHPYNGTGYARVSNENPPPEFAEIYKETYEGEILFLDEKLGELRDYLIRKGFYDETIIVFTADHGEEFYEHGGWWHGKTLYDEQIRVPLFIKLPQGNMQNTQSRIFVRGIDIGPSLLHLVDCEIPEQFQGISLFQDNQLIPGGVDIVYSEENFEGNILFSARGKTFKLMTANPDNPRGLPSQMLFNITSDPGETEDVYTVTEPKEFEALHEKIEVTSEYALDNAVSKETGEIDKTTQDRLKALGYIEE